MLLLGKKKKEFEEQKRLLEERRNRIDNNLIYSAQIQEQTKDTQKGNLEIAWKNFELNKRLVRLIAENKEKEIFFLEKEQKLKLFEDELNKRMSEIKRREQILYENEKMVKQREEEAGKTKAEAEQEIEKYQSLFDELQWQKEGLNFLEKDSQIRNGLALEREKQAESLFESAKSQNVQNQAKEAEFEAKRQEIESALREKMEEYERKIEELNSAKEFADNIKFDESEDGKAAKITVKEAIRQAKKSLADIKTQFDELDEKYCHGTFLGFSIPVSKIDLSFEELKAQYQQVYEHIKANEALPQSINRWLETIEEHIKKADGCIKSWEFSEGYSNIIFGLAACKNYELLLNILNDWAQEETDNRESEEQNEEFTDWYEALGINPDASKEEIKKRCNELLKKYHPDQNNGSPEFDEITQNIINARRILCDDEKRKEFDEERKIYQKRSKQ